MRIGTLQRRGERRIGSAEIDIAMWSWLMTALARDGAPTTRMRWWRCKCKAPPEVRVSVFR